MRRAGFAVQPHRPQQGIERLRAARQQPADNTRQHVAAAGHAEARRAARIFPGFARRRDDMAVHALHKDHRAEMPGGLHAAAERLAFGFLLVAIEKRRQLFGVGQEDWRRRAGVPRSLERFQQRDVERDRHV
jgi:hypothetical protein